MSRGVRILLNGASVSCATTDLPTQFTCYVSHLSAGEQISLRTNLCDFLHSCGHVIISCRGGRKRRIAMVIIIRSEDFVIAHALVDSGGGGMRGTSGIILLIKIFSLYEMYT